MEPHILAGGDLLHLTSHLPTSQRDDNHGKRLLNPDEKVNKNQKYTKVMTVRA
jgi:hypothetical protein